MGPGRKPQTQVFSCRGLFIPFSDQVITGHIEEYELGKRHLASIMGKDPEDFSREDVAVSETV